MIAFKCSNPACSCILAMVNPQTGAVQIKNPGSRSHGYKLRGVLESVRCARCGNITEFVASASISGKEKVAA